MKSRGIKAKSYYSTKFNLEEEKDSAMKELQKKLKELEDKARLHRKVKKISFPCEIRYEVHAYCGIDKFEFHAPSGGWNDDKDFHRTLAILVRTFGKFDRKFNEYSGAYYWQHKTKPKATSKRRELDVVLHDAVKPQNCVIVPFEEKVTRYKSICGEENNKLEVTENG